MHGALKGKLVKVQRCPATVSSIEQARIPALIQFDRSFAEREVDSNEYTSRHMAGFLYQPYCVERKAVSVVAFKSFSEEKIYMQPFRKFISILGLVVFLTGLAPVSNTQAQSDDAVDLTNTIQYLQSQLQPDGGFPGLSEGSDPGTTARALLAFSVIGEDPAQFVSSDGLTPIDYLLDSYPTNIYDDNQLLFPGNAGLILAALSLFQSAPDDLAPQILATLQADGSFSTTATKDWNSGVATDLSQALAILGLAAHGDQIPSSAIDYLLTKQLSDGTWDNGFGSDPDTTALVVIALLASGQVNAQNSAIQSAFQYFKTNQLENAGWRPAWDSSNLNVDTTGWITLALISAGEDLADWSVNGSTPQDALISANQPDGSIGSGFINVYSTVEALLGFADQALVPPLRPVEASTNKAGLVVTLPDTSSVLRCVEFTGETITGFELLESAGLQLETIFDPSMGNAVCGIEGQGCNSDNCFCGMPDYWSYWHLDPEGAAWAYSQLGANTFQVTPGAVEGWSWGEEPPVLVGFNEICGENPLLYLPAVMAEEQEPTSSVLLPLVENAGDGTPTSTASDSEQQQPQGNINQYLIYAAIVIGLMIILVLILREKRKS